MKTLVLLLFCAYAASADSSYNQYSPYLSYYPQLLSVDKKEELKYGDKVKVEQIYRPEYLLEYPYKIIGRHGFGFNIRTQFADGLRKPLIAERLVPINEVLEKVNGEAIKKAYIIKEYSE